MTWKARRAWDARKAWWLELATAVAVIVVVIVCAAHAWTAPLLLAPLLAVPPALAGVGARSFLRPLAYGAVSLVAAIIIAATASGDTHDVPVVTIVAIVVMTAISAAATAFSSGGQTEQIANVISVAETAQRAVLKPLPGQLGPIELGVIYLAAAADAKVGGDLYDVTTTEHGIRLVMGDVRGKGLGAVEVAADVLGMYREVAHDVHTLGELARRLDAGLSRRWGEHEEFVTALFVEIDPEIGRLSLFNCGHPPPILISADGVTVLEVPAPAPPLGLLTLGDSSGAARTLAFKPNDQLLLYTDGVTEARDRRRSFYPLDERLHVLQAKAKASSAGLGLLEAVRDDLLRHSGAPLEDDAALLLVRAPAVWPSVAAGRRQDPTRSRP